MTITRREFGQRTLAAVAYGLAPRRFANPIIPGWCADPEARIFENQYSITTYSAPYNDQLLFDAFSSPDLVTWTKHQRVLDAKNIAWAKRAVWAPTIVKKGQWATCSLPQTTSRTIRSSAASASRSPERRMGRSKIIWASRWWTSFTTARSRSTRSSSPTPTARTT